MTDLIDTTEMYLRTILDLEEEGIVPLRARISERLGHSGPTVSQTVSRMERHGLVQVADDRRLVLTEEGREKAVRVLRKHRIAEQLLASVIGMDLQLVHEEACRWEHVMSDDAERRIFDMLGQPRESPYGTPIPGLEAFGVEERDNFLSGVKNLEDFMLHREGPVEARVRRFGEPLQADKATLAVLIEAGIKPGTDVSVTTSMKGYKLLVRGTGEGVELFADIALHCYVSELGK